MLNRALLFGLVCGAMQAGPACVPGTLTSYINLNASGGCEVFGLRYFNFSFSVAENTDLIQVLPNNIPTSPGLGFSTPAVGPGVNATFSINYTIDPLAIMAGQRDILDPPSGNDVATQLLCLNQLFGGGANCADNSAPFSLTVNDTNPPGSLSGFLPFGALESMIDVRTIITLTGGATGASIDHLLTQTDVTQGAVPEPASIGLVATALLAMAGWRRRGGMDWLNRGHGRAGAPDLKHRQRERRDSGIQPYGCRRLPASA